MKRRHDVLLERPLKETGRNIDWTGALCRGVEEPDRWHVDHIRSLKQVTKEAIAECNKCPIKAECLEYALVNDIRHGVYGGHTTKERRKMLRDREAAA